jgi:hypothetical protein
LIKKVFGFGHWSPADTCTCRLGPSEENLASQRRGSECLKEPFYNLNFKITFKIMKNVSKALKNVSN